MAKDEFKEKKKDDEKEDEKKVNPLSILSMLPGIAGDVAKIASSPEKDSLRDMQQGGGVGTAALLGLGSQVGRDLQSAQATGHGATRGLNTAGTAERANAAIANLAPAMGMTAAREQALATEMLRQNRAAQIGSAADLGWKLTGGIGGAIANMVAAKDQGEGEEEEEQQRGGVSGGGEDRTPIERDPALQAVIAARRAAPTAGIMNVDPMTGLDVPPADPYQATIEAGQAGLDHLEQFKESLQNQQYPGASPDATPAQTPEEQAVERERGAEARRDMQRAQTEADKAVVKATSSRGEIFPDAPLGSAMLVPNGAPPSPIANDQLAEYLWNAYRDGDIDAQALNDMIELYDLGSVFGAQQ